MVNFVLQSMGAMFPIVFLVVMGYWLSLRGWFDEKSEALISRLVTTISLPCSIFVGLTGSFTADQLMAILPDTSLPMLSMLLAMIIGVFTSRFLDIRRGRRGAFQVNFFISNTMFIGLPVNLALFGDESVPAVMLYYVINVLLFWTLGVNLIVRDLAKSREGFFTLNTLKQIMSPSLISFFAAVAFVFSGLHLPDPLRASLRYAGNMTTALSLIFIGIEISKISIRHFKFEKDVVWGLFGRYVICPICVLVLTPFLTASPMSVRVFTMQAAMPAMTVLTIVTKQYEADSQYTAALSFITIMFGLAVIPIYMTIVNLCF